jgi:hypothetical protein
MNTELKEKMQKAANELRSEFELKYGNGSNLIAKDVAVWIEQTFTEGTTAMYTALKDQIEWVNVEEKFIPNMIKPYSIIIRLKSGKIVILGNDYDIMLKSLKNNTLFLKSIGRDDIITHWRRIEL